MIEIHEICGWTWRFVCVKRLSQKRKEKVPLRNPAFRSRSIFGLKLLNTPHQFSQSTNQKPFFYVTRSLRCKRYPLKKGKKLIWFQEHTSSPWHGTSKPKFLQLPVYEELIWNLIDPSWLWRIASVFEWLEATETRKVLFPVSIYFLLSRSWPLHSTTWRWGRKKWRGQLNGIFLWIKKRGRAWVMQER